MNVLSLFDGMGCCHIALNELGIKVDKYYASEVDKYAIQQTKLNFPDIVHLGSVTDVDVSKLEHIDLLAGGSPCQSFSFAGKRNGMSTTDNVEIYTLQKYMKLKEHGFEFDGESYLFWEYMRILTDIRKYNPDVLFLLENVEMGKKWERILSEAIGIYGVHINSALVSAQNRKRIYWTNIRTRPEGFFGDLHSDIPQPADRGILLKDILEDNVDEKYYLSDKMIRNMKQWEDTGNGIIGHSGSGGQKGSIYNTENKIGSLCATDYKQAKQICVAMRGRNPDNPIDRTTCAPTEQRLEPRRDNKTNTITSVQKDNLAMQLNERQQNNFKNGDEKANTFLSTSWKGSQANGMTLVVSEATAKGFPEIKSGTLRTHKDGNGFREVQSGKGACVPARAREDGSVQNVAQIGNRIRRLTPTECARLQTIPDWYKWEVSETQQYKLLGNGWTVEVIKHIFKHINHEKNKQK